MRRKSRGDGSNSNHRFKRSVSSIVTTQIQGAPVVWPASLRPMASLLAPRQPGSSSQQLATVREVIGEIFHTGISRVV
jgi:hypothetical protein